MLCRFFRRSSLATNRSTARADKSRSGACAGRACARKRFVVAMCCSTFDYTRGRIIDLSPRAADALT
jgi:hypothetical protein